MIINHRSQFFVPFFIRLQQEDYLYTRGMSGDGRDHNYVSKQWLYFSGVTCM